MPKFGKQVLQSIPALKLLLPLAAGILLQYHLAVSLAVIIAVFITGVVVMMVYSFLHTAKQFNYRWLSGFAVACLFTAVGAGLSYYKNIEHHRQWIGHYYQPNAPVLVTLKEPIVTKQKSFKAEAVAEAVLINNEWLPVEGNILLYFKKDSTKPVLDYGSQIVVTQNLAPIINAGNPGGFNYARYCSFQHIYHQAFLKDDGFITLATTKKTAFNKWMIETRTSILSVLRNNISMPNELGIAEALLIGYRDDLDRDLVQSYSNTGVVHIIAISGLHLGMIYGLLLVLLKPIQRYHWGKILKPVLILMVLWGFSFIAGMAPSIFRSAVMFSFIVVGELMGKRGNMYNSLAASAFLLLCIDPFYLWDVGFQLSYTAVLSIVVFQKHINRWLYFDNKLLRKIWALNSVTLSAQILTLPIVLYHFHQFPLLFLLTNLIAVPLSGLILYAELLLLNISSIERLAAFTGNIISWLISQLNAFIIHIDSLPFVVWPSIQISIPQAIILYVSITGFTLWFITQQRKAVFAGLFALLLFVCIRSVDFIQKEQQQKIIVYNVPNHTAIDLIEGRKYQFIGDSVLTADGFLRNFHIKPSRVLNRITPADSLNNIIFQNNVITAKSKRILIIDNDFEIVPQPQKIKVDAIILTKNPKVYLSRLSTSFECKLYIFDSSNPFWKIAYWQKDADSLHLRHHSTATQGAFVMNF